MIKPTPGTDAYDDYWRGREVIIGRQREDGQWVSVHTHRGQVHLTIPGQPDLPPLSADAAERLERKMVALLDAGKDVEGLSRPEAIAVASALFGAVEKLLQPGRGGAW